MFKRIAVSLLAIAMVSLVVSAASFALFTASSSNVGNTFTAGTVTLNGPLHDIVDIHNIAPGDSGSMSYAIEYTGSLNAWIGIDTVADGELLTCDGGKFTIALADAAGNSYGASVADQVVGVYAPNQTLNLTVAWELDITAGNDCQGKSAMLSLLVKAVQHAHNDDGAGGPISWN